MVFRHWLCGDFKYAFRARDPSSEPHVVWISHPRSLQILGLRGHPRPQCAGLECHQAGLGNVSHEAIPLKEANQHVHQVLQLIRVSRAIHAVIGVEKTQTPTNWLSQPIMWHPLVFHCYGKPCLDDILHDHVEECQRHKAALRCSLCGWEGWPVIAILSWNHLLVVPESLQESARASSLAVSLQVLD